MWKMISGIGFAIMIAMSVGKSTVAGYNAGQIAAGPAAKINVEQVLEQNATILNKKKGQTNGPNTFEGASVNGRTLVHEYTTSMNPNNPNMAAGLVDFRQKLSAEFCKGDLAKLLKQGAAFDFNYRAPKTGQLVIGMRIDAANCPG